MQFDWTSFTLELLNFLVLLWILKRFLYRPVLATLDARRQGLRDEAARADAVRKEAEAMKAQYEARLETWKQEQEQARRQLEQELAQTRATQLEAMKQKFAEERERAQKRDEALTAAREASLTRKSARRAFRASAAMLRRLASPELTARIVEMFEQDLRSLPDSQRDALQTAASRLEPKASAEVASAHALDAGSQQRITAALSSAAGRELHAVFSERPDLISGLRVAVGECLLQANLADELSFFEQQEPHA